MRESVLRGALLLFGLLAGVASAGVWSVLSLQPAAADDNARPVIVPVSLSTPTTERFVYPPQVPVSPFDGAYTEATVYKSGVYAGNRVAFWESEAGGLRSFDFPRDEFVYVLDGSLHTTDANGTKRSFRAGDTFVIPKGWVGLWEMSTHFKKLIVNF